MALDRSSVQRLADVLGDYEGLTACAVPAASEQDFELLLTDHRFGATYLIASHADYWDFLGYFADHKQWPSPSRPADAA